MYLRQEKTSTLTFTGKECSQNRLLSTCLNASRNGAFSFEPVENGTSKTRQLSSQWHYWNYTLEFRPIWKSSGLKIHAAVLPFLVDIYELCVKSALRYETTDFSDKFEDHRIEGMCSLCFVRFSFHKFTVFSFILGREKLFLKKEMWYSYHNASYHSADVAMATLDPLCAVFSRTVSVMFYFCHICAIKS